jgi:RimJ/RimL family protein N-acetyltransferase
MADARNLASGKVLEKCGLKRSGNFLMDDISHDWFHISSKDQG